MIESLFCCHIFLFYFSKLRETAVGVVGLTSDGPTVEIKIRIFSNKLSENENVRKTTKTTK